MQPVMSDFKLKIAASAESPTVGSSETLRTRAHQLAALLAVEREAAFALTAASVESERVFQQSIFANEGATDEASHRADAVREAARRAWVAARADVDQALAALAGVEVAA